MLDRVASNVPDRYAPVLGHFLDHFGEFNAPFFAEFREDDTDEFFVHSRIEAEVGLLDGLFDGMDRGRVPGLNQDHAWFGRSDAGQFADAHLRAVNIHYDVLDQAWRGLARAHAGELILHHVLGFLHFI